MVVADSLGPWITAQAAFVGSFQVSGMDGDGKISLWCGIIAIGLLGFLVASPHSAVLGFLALLPFTISALVGYFDWNDVSSRVGEIDANVPLRASVGWGLQAVTFGSLAGMVFSVVQAWQGLESRD